MPWDVLGTLALSLSRHRQGQTPASAHRIAPRPPLGSSSLQEGDVRACAVVTRWTAGIRQALLSWTAQGGGIACLQKPPAV